MSYLRKLWDNISEQWKNIFIHKFFDSAINSSRWSKVFVSKKFLDTIYHTEVLNVENVSLKDLSGLTLLPHLKKLHLVSNELKSLEGIENLSGLKELVVSRNQIQNIYPLFLLPQLEFLDISYNHITYLFPLFKSNIQQLYCSFNKIRTLDGLEKLKNLKILDASNNQLKEIDFTPWECPLQELWVSRNKIESINFSVKLNLEILDISFNPISMDKIPSGYSFELIAEGIPEKEVKPM